MKVFSGTFYPLKFGELYNRCHYNNKMALLEYFDLKTFCYNSTSDKTEIIKRKEDNRELEIWRFNEQGNDFSIIEKLFSLWKPNVINFHGGNSGQKGTARELINIYKNSGIKFGLEYGGGYDKNSMMQHYYNENADYVIMNHHLWKDFFPTDYQHKIKITPKQQSVDSNFFIPMDIKKEYDIMMLGRYDGGNKGHGDIYRLFNNSDVKVLLKGNEIPSSFNSNNIIVEDAEYDHVKIREVFNKSRLFVWGTKRAIENPYAIHTRVIVEALSCGIPVVAYQDAFIESNLLYNEYNSFLVHDEFQFREKVNLLLNDKVLYEKMSNNARKVAIDCDISYFMEFYKKLWLEIGK